MTKKLSTFVRETQEREEWLNSVRDVEPGVPPEQLLAVAALLRGVQEAIPDSDEAEELSRARAIAELQEIQLSRGQSGPVRAPWYLEFGRFLRLVFTLGRRR